MNNDAEKNTNKYALVTGGTSGIGYEIAKLLAKDKYNLIIVARLDEQLTDVQSELSQEGIDVKLIKKDLFSRNAALEIYDEIKSSGLAVEIVVNNAGQGQRGMFHEVPLDRNLEIIDLNIVSLVSLTHLFLGDMMKRNSGKILNLASVVSKTPAPEFSVYAATKAFVLSFSEALAKELEETGITITALLPGRTDTDFFHKAEMEDTKEYQDHKLADPAEVAKDGYEAMMSGESRIISGAQNKAMIAMMNTMSDSANAAFMQKNIQPSEKDVEERKVRPAHRRSRQEHAASSKKKV